MSTFFEVYRMMYFLFLPLGQPTIQQNLSMKCTVLTATSQIMRLSRCAEIMRRSPNIADLVFHNTSESGRVFEFKLHFSDS